MDSSKWINGAVACVLTTYHLKLTTYKLVVSSTDAKRVRAGIGLRLSMQARLVGRFVFQVLEKERFDQRHYRYNEQYNHYNKKNDVTYNHFLVLRAGTNR